MTVYIWRSRNVSYRLPFPLSGDSRATIPCQGHGRADDTPPSGETAQHRRTEQHADNGTGRSFKFNIINQL